MRSRQSTEAQQHSQAQVPDQGTCQTLSAFSILLQLLAGLKLNFQLSTKKEEGVGFIKADNKRPLWGPLCEVPPQTDMTVFVISLLVLLVSSYFK